MRILDRYLGAAVIGGTLLTLLVLLAMLTFFALVEGLGDVGRGTYGITGLLQELALTTPRRVVEIFPMAALIGSLLGLGVLASNSELTVVRAAGVSLTRIAGAVMKAGAILMVLVLLLGELVAPGSETLAQRLHARALSGAAAALAGQAYWVREGRTVVNVGRMLSDERVENVYIYEFDAEHRLRTTTHAERATYRGGRWLLEDVRQSQISERRVVARRLARAEWSSDLGPSLLNVGMEAPERLSALALVRYIRYLRANRQDSAPYEFSLWGKLLTPATTGVMIFFALPFVFGPLRSTGMGQRILVGALLGIGFQVLNQAFVQVGLVYGFPPLPTSAAPTLLFLAIALWMLRRVR